MKNVEIERNEELVLVIDVCSVTDEFPKVFSALDKIEEKYEVDAGELFGMSIGGIITDNTAYQTLDEEEQGIVWEAMEKASKDITDGLMSSYGISVLPAMYDCLHVRETGDLYDTKLSDISVSADGLIGVYVIESFDEDRYVSVSGLREKLGMPTFIVGA